MNFPCNHLRFRKYLISGTGMFFYSSSSIMNIFCGSCRTEPYVLLTCPFSCFLTREAILISTKVSFDSYLIVLNNAWTWLATNVWCKWNLLPYCFSENEHNDGRRELIFKPELASVGNSFCFFSLSHLSFNKASECFMGLNGALQFAQK